MHSVKSFEVKQWPLSALREAWLSEHILMVSLDVSFEIKTLHVSIIAQVSACVIVVYLPKGLDWIYSSVGLWSIFQNRNLYPFLNRPCKYLNQRVLVASRFPRNSSVARTR